MVPRRSRAWLPSSAAILLGARLVAATCDVDPAGTPCEDDGNPCSLDLCDEAGTCVHPAGGQAACDDGDPCTIDDTCADGVCAGTVVPGSCIDAALCYRTHAEEGFDRVPARFEDPTTLTGGRVARPGDLCLPARTDGGAIIDPAVSSSPSRSACPVPSRRRCGV